MKNEEFWVAFPNCKLYSEDKVGFSKLFSLGNCFTLKCSYLKNVIMHGVIIFSAVFYHSDSKLNSLTKTSNSKSYTTPVLNYGITGEIFPG